MLEGGTMKPKIRPITQKDIQTFHRLVANLKRKLGMDQPQLKLK